MSNSGDQLASSDRGLHGSRDLVGMQIREQMAVFIKVLLVRAGRLCCNEETLSRLLCREENGN